MPQTRTNEREKTREAMPPATEMSKKTHQQVGEQCHPYLPQHCILVVADKVIELDRLLQFLEEHLNLPAGTIQFGDGPYALQARLLVTNGMMTS